MSGLGREQPPGCGNVPYQKLFVRVAGSIIGHSHLCSAPSNHLILFGCPGSVKVLIFARSMMGIHALPVIGECLDDTAVIDATLATSFDHRL